MNKLHYFRTKEGEKIYFADLGERITAEHPHLIGRHIFDQLRALGLWDKFETSTTSHALPYSFTD